MPKLSSYPPTTTLEDTDQFVILKNTGGNKNNSTVTGAALKTYVGGFASVSTQAGSSYTFVVSDVGKYIRATHAAAKTFTIPTNAVAAMAIGVEIHVRNAAAGDLTFATSAGVSLNIPYMGTLNLGEQASATLKKVASDEWDLLGDTKPQGS